MPLRIANALLTGSQAYGTPTSKSDVDLVVLVDRETERHLNDLLAPASYHDGSGGPSVDNSIRCGKLNVITETDPAAFGVWVRGTKDLVKLKPVAREEAVKHFQKLRAEARKKAKK